MSPEAVIGWLISIVLSWNLAATVDVLAYISVLPAPPVPDCLPILITSVAVEPKSKSLWGLILKSSPAAIVLIDESSPNYNPPPIIKSPLALISPEAVMLPINS